ncbi:MAG: YfcE family phosphodiesterase [Gemmataceae bacterium]|nr:YfcE family phosphodiesterase [Gemmataceae bacterium]
MRIAIVSDTHSRIAAVERALALIAERGIARIIHCGDLEDADTVRLFPPQTQFVFGNCDHDRDGIRDAVARSGGRLHEPFGHLTIAGKSIAFVHGDDGTLLRDLLAAKTFDYLFHGHTHIRRDEHVGPTRVINPGALHRARPKTFAILDVATGELETVVVE